MAKGTLVFEFDSALDLENQMRAYLRLPKLVEITLGEAETPHACACRTTAEPHPAPRIGTPDPLPSDPVAETPRGVLGRLGEGMTAGKPDTASEKAPTHTEPVKESAPVKEEPQPAQTPARASGEVPTVTLENLADQSFPYEKLLEFCAANPKVGIDPAKCAVPFMRPMVEHKIKVFLTTIT